MKVDSSDITLQTHHELVEFSRKTERLNAWVGDRPEEKPAVNVNLSPAARAQLAAGKLLPETAESTVSTPPRAKSPPLPMQQAEQPDEVEPLTKLTPQQQLEMRIVESLLERITGKRVKLLPTVRIDGEKLEQKRLETETALMDAARKPNAVEQERVSWGLEYDYEETHYEGEFSSFRAAGRVRTEDGREFSVDVGLLLKRESVEQQFISIRAGDAVFTDPLLINFDGKGVELTVEKFEFDLDADGKPDEVSLLENGSGFLVQDRNENGKVDDGSELFGPATGSGFREIAEHDDDGDGWIEESDEIFHDLKIWAQGADGAYKLFSLAEKDVGAIYQGSAETEFKLLGEDSDQADGQLRESGLYLAEDGTPGLVQEIDLRQD